MWYECQWYNSPLETKRPKVYTYTSSCDLQQWAKPYRIVSYKSRPEMTNVNQFKWENYNVLRLLSWSQTHRKAEESQLHIISARATWKEPPLPPVELLQTTLSLTVYVNTGSTSLILEGIINYVFQGKLLTRVHT